jgi:hypothetical protein
VDADVRDDETGVAEALVAVGFAARRTLERMGRPL